jgi:hypothetical protein
LLEEKRDPVAELGFSCRPVWPSGDLCLASREQFRAIVGDENVHHADAPLFGGWSPPAADRNGGT